MIALPNGLEQTSSTLDVGPPSLVSILMFVFTLFLSSELFASPQDDRRSLQGQRSDAGEAGKLQALLRNALQLPTLDYDDMVEESELLDDNSAVPCHRPVAWLLPGTSAIGFYFVSHLLVLPRLAIASRPGQPQAPPPRL